VPEALAVPTWPTSKAVRSRPILSSLVDCIRSPTNGILLMKLPSIPLNCKYANRIAIAAKIINAAWIALFNRGKNYIVLF
jgi:hypothetical protein